MDTVERIFDLLARSGMEQKKFAGLIGTTEKVVSNWKAGRVKSYRKYLPQIAEVLGTSVEYLLTGEEARPALRAVEPTGRQTLAVTIPVLGDVAAGIPIEAVENIIDYEEIDAATAATGEFFGLRLKGSSMEPRMREGDVVIVRKQDDAETGDTVVALVNGNSATVKRLKKTEAGIALIPNNPAYDPMFFSNEEIQQLPVRLIGKVVELRAKF